MSDATLESERPPAADYSDATSTFGDRLALAREAVGLPQADLAQRMGIKLQTLRNWEEDRSEPRANKLQLLAGMLNVSMVWLMTGRGDAPAAVAEDGLAPNAQACLTELRSLRAEAMRLSERLGRLEKRLRAVVA
jgi:HTH-type transcriptional regulator, cell division transcriptional repressor